MLRLTRTSENPLQSVVPAKAGPGALRFNAPKTLGPGFRRGDDDYGVIRVSLKSLLQRFLKCLQLLKKRANDRVRCSAVASMILIAIWSTCRLLQDSNSVPLTQRLNEPSAGPVWI